MNLDLNAKIPTPSLNFDQYGLSGGAFGLGYGYGLSVSETTGKKYTLRDLGNDIKDLWEGIFGGGG